MLDSQHREVCIDQFMSTLTNHVCCVCILQVKKRDLMRYTGDGELPFCMITMKPISDETTPSNLECTVFLEGTDLPNVLQLTRQVEYSNSQLHGCKLQYCCILRCINLCIHQ